IPSAMSRVAPVIPAETDVLCEGCGYTLNGLPDESNCPECGKPIHESIGRERRIRPAWERATTSPTILGGFVRTTAEVMFRPTHFYRTLATRLDPTPAALFARIHWIIAAFLFGLAAFNHLNWYVGTVLL